MTDKGRWTHPRWVVAIAATAVLACLLLDWIPLSSRLFSNWEAPLQDLLWRALPANPRPSDQRILIVDIDQRSINRLGRYHSWPRKRMATLLHQLKDAGVRTVVLDMLFDPSPEPEADNPLVNAARECGNVVLACQFSNADSSAFLYPMDRMPDELRQDAGLSYEGPRDALWTLDRVECGMPELLAAGAAWGFVNGTPDPGGVFRRSQLLVEFAGGVYPSLALAATAQTLGWPELGIRRDPGQLTMFSGTGDSLAVQLDREGMLVLNYRGPSWTFRRVSFYDVLEGRLDPEYLKDKLVLIGSSLPGLDLKPIPLEDSFPGVEIQATAISNLLNGDPVKHLGGQGLAWLLALPALISGAGFAQKRLWVGSLVLGMVLAAIWILALLALRSQGLLLPLLLPLLAALLAGGGVVLFRLRGEVNDRHFITDAFSRYVSSDVLTELLEHPDRLRLGGERSSLSLLFSDIRSFTQLSEGLNPSELGGLLNRYLTAMSHVLLDHGGTLDKYIGDAVVAIFGAPLPLENQERRACQAALDMQLRLVELRRELAGTAFADIAIGIGVHTGPVLVGNFGSELRFSYTAIGDAMNLASRLEGLTKAYGTGILVSRQTLDATGGVFASRRLDRIRVMGKQDPVEIHALYLPHQFPDLACRDSYQRAWDLYEQGDFSSALALFERHVEDWPADGPGATLRQRCRILVGSPRPNWDGAWQMDRK
ncbi:MAG: adenylate/guanylate cyclase domain-containing protein [Candidatus Delongbacteria bacterium]|nr:adenylate/guanylate cyclase domain-containing protein [Candidatus Delongbacteria bacterium]